MRSTMGKKKKQNKQTKKHKKNNWPNQRGGRITGGKVKFHDLRPLPQMYYTSHSHFSSDNYSL